MTPQLRAALLVEIDELLRQGDAYAAEEVARETHDRLEYVELSLQAEHRARNPARTSRQARELRDEAAALAARAREGLTDGT